MGEATPFAAMLDRLRLRDLSLLVAIQEHKSITAAASQLGLTQPAASRTLRDIEQSLRLHVFERDRLRGMSPTLAGEIVISGARALIADGRSLARDLDAYRAGTGGHLRLGIIPFMSGPLIEGLIGELMEERMSLSFKEAPTTSLVDDLRMERLDAVIGRCSDTPLPPGLAQDILLRQEGCLVVHAHHPLVRAQRVTLGALAQFRWLLAPQGTPTRDAIDEVFAKAKLPPPSATVEASSVRIIHAALRADPRMVTIVPSGAGDDLARLGGVRRLAFPVALSMPPIGLICAARHRDTPAVRNLRNKLRELVRKRRIH